MAHKTQRYILKWANMITPSVKHLGFVREDEAPIPFKAGQFITLHIDGPTKILHRSYSIANVPHKNNMLELAISYVEGGVASNLLFNLKPGESVNASGPFGLFTLKEEKPARYILVSTGTGVAPYRSMLDELRGKILQDNITVDLILGVRGPQELLFAEDFLSLSKEHPQFKFSVCFSREARNPEFAPHERLGHVQDLFPGLNMKPDSDVVYLCGNPNMIDDAYAKLTDMGFDRSNVRREKYLFSH